MAEVHVRFAGVAAVGPGRPRDDSSLKPYPRKGPFYGVFPASSRRKTASGSHAGPYIPFHLPVLITDMQARDGRKSDDVIPDKNDNPQFYMWYPFRERLVFDITPTDEPVLTYEHTNASQLPAGDVDLIADFRDIWPTISMMPPEAASLDVDPHDVPSRIGGQVFIPFGHVSSAEGLHPPQKVTFEPRRPIGAKAAYQATIVSQAVVTFQADDITIRSWSLDTGEALDDITFEIHRETTIWVANADPADVRKYPLDQTVERPGEEPQPVGGGSDGDFELYYSILAPGMKSDLPIPGHGGAMSPFFVKDCYVAMTDVMQ